LVWLDLRQVLQGIQVRISPGSAGVSREKIITKGLHGKTSLRLKRKISQHTKNQNTGYATRSDELCYNTFTSLTYLIQIMLWTNCPNASLIMEDGSGSKNIPPECHHSPKGVVQASAAGRNTTN
jgi:hypothetical protein